MSEKYKITWRLGDDIWENEPLYQAFLDIVARKGQAADELNLFISEPTSHAYHPLERVARKCENFRKAAVAARKLGMRVGIDQWPSFGAEEAYQSLDQDGDMPFAVMVGYDGRKATRLACPISPEFLDYTRKKFRMFAEAGPDFIWIDDDCRFTYLGGVEYPCFCPRCVAGFQEGRFHDRESLVKALNEPENSELRRAWSRYGAQRLAAYCACAREAVNEVDERIDVPLMTVGYTHTTFSGDYIEACMEAAHSRAGRPGHGFYWDDTPGEMFTKTLEAARQVQRYPTQARMDVQYEEESCPCTPLNKTPYTRMMEGALSIWGGCTGIAFNHTTQASGPEPFRHMKREAMRWNQNRRFFDQYLSFAGELPMAGLWIGDNEYMMAGMQVDEKGWFQERNKEDYDIRRVDRAWAAMGMALSVDRENAYGAVLQGKVVDTYSDEEIQTLFEKPVWIDAQGLAALEQRGLGSLTGVKLGRARYGASERLTDAVVNGGFGGDTHTGLFEPAYELLPLDENVEILSRAVGPGDADYGACTIRHGNTIVMGYSPYRFLGTVGKLCQMRNLAWDMGAPCIVEPINAYDIARVSCWARWDGKRAAILLINASLENVPPFDLRIRGCMEQAECLGMDTADQMLEVVREDGASRVRIDTMKPWEMKLILAQ